MPNQTDSTAGGWRTQETPVNSACGICLQLDHRHAGYGMDDLRAALLPSDRRCASAPSPAPPLRADDASFLSPRWSETASGALGALTERKRGGDDERLPQPCLPCPAADRILGSPPAWQGQDLGVCLGHQRSASVAAMRRSMASSQRRRWQPRAACLIVRSCPIIRAASASSPRARSTACELRCPEGYVTVADHGTEQPELRSPPGRRARALSR